MDHKDSAESDSEEDGGEFSQYLAGNHSDNVLNGEAPGPDGNGDVLQLDGAHLGPDDPEDRGVHLGHISQTPFFCNNAVIKFLGARHFEVSERDVAGWRDALDFLAKRYGLMEISGREDFGKKRTWSKKLGFNVPHPDESAVRLYDAVVGRGEWPSIICDLSPDIVPTAGIFPSPTSGNVLAVGHTTNGYIVAVQDGKTRPWKLLVSDPLTILQIEREHWCSDGGGLVTNLIKKGIPFEILHTGCHESTVFVGSPGPILHPTEREPRLADYFAYRHDLVDFLRAYPHAHAAALCAGGILWRTAVDVLPLPSEDAIIGPFHRDACISRVINGDTYWTPRLTSKEEQVLVGVYRWAESKQSYDGGTFTDILQVPPKVLGTIAGGRSVTPGLDPDSTLARGLPSMKTGIRSGVLASPAGPMTVFERINGASTSSTKKRVPPTFS